MKGFIIYLDYEIINDETIAFLYGRLENGQSFVTQNRIEPYFFIKESDESSVLKYLKKFKVEKTKFTNFSGEKVIKISAKTQTELNKLSKAIYKTAETYESDIKPHYRFIMDNNLLGTL